MDVIKDIKNSLNLLFSQFKEYERKYKNDLNDITNKAKLDINNTFNKYTSLLIVLILLYFLKDIILWLLLKFDKLLKG
jgi:hypothetical protein